METAQSVFDKKSPHACEALREHLGRLEVQACEERDRVGYSKQPQTRDESQLWEAKAAWPAE